MIDYNNILEEANQLKDWLIKVRRYFHKFPELSTDEKETRRVIIQHLEKHQIPYKTFTNHYGILGLIEGAIPGKTVALRADMDGLPINDNKKTSYTSTITGKIHGCGHDAHMTILLGAAIILNKMKKQLKGNVKLIFQPAEETIGGAKPMIQDGVLEKSKVDAIFGLHVSPEIPVGKIGVKYGQMNASSDNIKIIITGSSTHGAYPHEGIDAITIAGQIITALQTIVSRNIDPRESAVITIGTINGGSQGNIVAQQVTMTGTVRTLNQQVRKTVLNKIEAIIKNIAKGMGGEGELSIKEGYPTLINNDKTVNIVKENAIELLNKEAVMVLEKASLGVEDFSYFLQEVQGAFYRLGSGNADKNTTYPVHSDLFDIDEDCLVTGVALQVVNCLRILL